MVEWIIVAIMLVMVVFQFYSLIYCWRNKINVLDHWCGYGLWAAIPVNILNLVVQFT